MASVLGTLRCREDPLHPGAHPVRPRGERDRTIEKLGPLDQIADAETSGVARSHADAVIGHRHGQEPTVPGYVDAGPLGLGVTLDVRQQFAQGRDQLFAHRRWKRLDVPVDLEGDVVAPDRSIPIEKRLEIAAKAEAMRNGQRRG